MTNGKADKFKKLAERRVTKIMLLLDQLGKLSRRGSYEYTPEQVEKIFNTVGNKLDTIEGMFVPKEKMKEEGTPQYQFTL